jgi:hypothetical protein
MNSKMTLFGELLGEIAIDFSVALSMGGFERILVHFSVDSSVEFSIGDSTFRSVGFSELTIR